MVSPIQTKLNRATFILKRGDHDSIESPARPTLNIENDRLTVHQSQGSPGRVESKLSTLSKDKPYAYKDFKLSSITKKAKYRDLYADHFENARKETSQWKPGFETKLESEGRKINKFKELVEFIDVNMQTAIRVSYDRKKSLDENL